MTWVSLVCLLVLSGTAFGGYGANYGGASVNQLPKLISMMRDRPVLSQGYGQQVQQPLSIDWSSALQQQPQQQDLSVQQKIQSTGYGNTIAKTLPAQGYGQTAQGYGQIAQGYGGMPIVQQFDQQIPQIPQIPQIQIETAADQLCRGQRAETVIPIEDGRKFVVCLDDGKGVEQQCPKGLFYHQESLRCERKLGPLENVCASQPCLNGGQCIPTDSSYQCQCAAGFDGRTCELDARVCQTQNPCGQTTDAKCQSFRLSAALQYVCIFQDGLAYGLSSSQVVPSPCRDVDGPQALSVSNHGFIMCDGERMFIESCPGGTIWDDLNKACVWPDMQVAPQQDQYSYGQVQYSQQQPKQIQSTYGAQYSQQQPKQIQSTYGAQYGQQQLEQPKQIHSTFGTQFAAPRQHHHRHHHQSKHQKAFGNQMGAPKHFDQQKQIQSGYGAQMAFPQTFEQSKFVQPTFGSELNVQRTQFELPKQIQSGYGAQISLPSVVDQSKLAQTSFNSQSNIVKPQLDLSSQIQTQYASQQQQPQQQSQDELVSNKQSSGY